MIGRLLILALNKIVQFTLTKEAIGLIHKEFSEVIFFSIKKNLFTCFEESHKQLTTFI